MKASLVAFLWAFSAIASAQDVFESSDFNVVEALANNGVNVSTIPALAGLSEKRAVSTGCTAACVALKTIFGNKLLTSGSPAYDAFTSGYWSVQAAFVDPACVAKPSIAQDLSILVLMSRLTQCPFAVKGGGHTAFPGASSIQDGITINMEDMNEITLSSDQKTAFIGPGNRWGSVYEKLGQHGLAVIGGRASEVGLGLVLGGGISHHSSIYGYACDNIASFEVVTAAGALITVTQTIHPDLYWALRGGGNNFGIVTRFEMETIPQGLMWGGTRVHPEATYPLVIDAFASMAEDASKDPNSAQILSFALAAGQSAAQIQLEYLKPVDELNPPAILKKYLNITSIHTDTMNRTLANDTSLITDQMPKGHRYAFWASTFKLDRDLMNWLQERHRKDFAAMPNKGSLTFQVFTVPAMRRMSRKGGNALGPSPTDGPLMHSLLYLVWSDASQDTNIQRAAQNFISTAKTEAKRRGKYHDFIYLNYAGPYQNVIPSYGKEKLARLKAVSKMYDPAGVFQKLQPGGFKLEGAPFGERI
ncbi:hypothetical protein COCMIDRAFT_1060 [Bipolaris oryzae ATCC 44560]|uniref:FAD-binding PCMH-type domain-containing protein n=1 Tax=Bipolaris oryzae ATCC 44560 TaxID=930090 RepID=W6ZS53_COCMI|nr:uncharacterized protein COCMIDRAFT_1060 [Bipolaris oryzae ATCC 44560]EUC50339.1 hypothetical protein COCMIDRAFT_1060 [Bipolaris oryzae ATCC 44560]